MSLNDCFRAIGAFISGFARFILFFASLLFLVISLILLAFLYQSNKNFTYVQIDQIYTSLLVLKILGVYLVCLALYGIYASFFASKTSTRLFAFLSTLNVIIGIGILMYASPRFDGIHDDTMKKMNELRDNYDWSHNKDASDVQKNATWAWDSLQTDLECCGVESPNDWNKYRPQGHVADDIYPTSCCKEELPKGEIYCRKSMPMWDTGCIHMMEDTNHLIMTIITIMICYSMLIGLLAGVVLVCKPQDTYHYDY